VIRRRTVLQHLDSFQRDQSAAHHGIDRFHKSLDFFLGVDDLDHERQILGKAQETNSRVLAFVRRHRVPLAAAAVGTAVLTLRSGRRAVGRGLAHRHPLGFALVAGVVGLALGVMAPDEERI